MQISGHQLVLHGGIAVMFGNGSQVVPRSLTIPLHLIQLDVQLFPVHLPDQHNTF